MMIHGNPFNLMSILDANNAIKQNAKDQSEESETYYMKIRMVKH